MDEVLLISCRDSKFFRIFFRACGEEGGRKTGRERENIGDSGINVRDEKKQK